jgi:hypothetical protein
MRAYTSQRPSQPSSKNTFLGGGELVTSSLASDPQLGRGHFHRGTVSEGPSCLSGRHERARGGTSVWDFAREREEMLSFSVPPGYRRLMDLQPAEGRS